MNPWKELYEELSELILHNIPDIRWVDLWHEQVQYLTAELPFPTPSIFIGFNIVGIEDQSEKIQNCNTQVDFYLFYETFSDTYAGSYNKTSALEFLDSLNSLHALFHATSGNSYSEMRRVDQKREESGGAGNLYRISFACNVTDDGAMSLIREKDLPNGEVILNRSDSIEKPSVNDTEEDAVYQVH